MEPINYSMDVQSPFQAALQGYQAGTAIRNDQAQQQALQQAQARQQQMNADLSAAFQDHTMLPSVMIKYPEIADKLKIGLDASNAQHAQQTLNQITPIYAALQSGNVDVAATQAAGLSTAYRNAGMQDKAEAMDAMIAHMKVNPQDTATRLAGRIAVLPGGDKILDGVKSSILLPSDVATSRAGASKAQSEAVVSGVAAGNAATKADLDNQKAQQEIQTAEAQRRINELNVQIAQADSETKRGQLILERDKQQAELAKQQQAQGQAGQDQIDTINQALGTVNAITNHPGLKNGFWDFPSYPGTFAGAIAAHVPGTDRKDLEAMVDTLKSQQFLAGVKEMRGTGALSDAEGARIERAISSLDTNQSVSQFKNALGVIKANLEKAQAKTIARGQAPTSGTTTPVIMTHPQFGQVRDADVNRLMQKYPGQTREQILQFLRDTGGK